MVVALHCVVYSFTEASLLHHVIITFTHLATFYSPKYVIRIITFSLYD